MERINAQEKKEIFVSIQLLAFSIQHSAFDKIKQLLHQTPNYLFLYKF